MTRLAQLKQALDTEQGPAVQRRMQLVAMLHLQQQPAAFHGMQSPFAAASAAMSVVTGTGSEGQFLQAAQQVEELQVCMRAEHEAWARFQKGVAQVRKALLSRFQPACSIHPTVIGITAQAHTVAFAQGRLLCRQGVSDSCSCAPRLSMT